LPVTFLFFAGLFPLLLGKQCYQQQKNGFIKSTISSKPYKVLPHYDKFYTAQIHSQPTYPQPRFSSLSISLLCFCRYAIKVKPSIVPHTAIHHSIQSENLSRQICLATNALLASWDDKFLSGLILLK
jgi:hypothetical protein